MIFMKNNSKGEDYGRLFDETWLREWMMIGMKTWKRWNVQTRERTNG